MLTKETGFCFTHRVALALQITREVGLADRDAEKVKGPAFQPALVTY